MKRNVLKIIPYISIVLMAVFLFSNYCLSADPGVTDKEVVFGMHAALTGLGAWVGLGARDGLTMAFDEINGAGGVHGRKLTFVAEDDEYTASKAISAVRKLIELHKVFAVICGSGSTSALPVSEIVREYKIPYYNPVAANPKIHEPFSKYVFNGAVPPADKIGRSMADIGIQKKGFKRPAILNETGEWPKSIVVGLMEYFNEKGIAPVTKQEFTLGDKDHSAQLLAIKRANADVVLFCGTYVDFGNVIRQAPGLGLRAQWIADPTCSNESVLGVAGEAAEGAITGWPPCEQFTNDPGFPMGEFIRRYKTKYPNSPIGRPNHIDIYLYADGYVIAEAVKRAGRDLDREKFVTALESIKNFVAGPNTDWRSAVPIGLPRTFDSHNHWGTKSITFLEVKNGKFTKTGYRYETK